MARILFAPIREKSAMSAEISNTFDMLYLNVKVCMPQCHETHSSVGVAFGAYDNLSCLLIGGVLKCDIYVAINRWIVPKFL